MRINVIGYDTVGKAQTFLLQRLKHEVFIFDPYLFPAVGYPEKNVDLTFVCTTENAVDEALQNLIRERVAELYVIKSTTSIGTTEKLTKKYGVHIAHNPEFLREQYGNEDIANPDRIIIGQCCEEPAEKLGLNIREVAKLFRADSRVSAYGASKFGQPFGGKCLPSNLDQLIEAFHSEGLNPLLFDAVKEYNLRLQK